MVLSACVKSAFSQWFVNADFTQISTTEWKLQMNYWGELSIEIKLSRYNMKFICVSFYKMGC